MVRRRYKFDSRMGTKGNFSTKEDSFPRKSSYHIDVIASPSMKQNYQIPVTSLFTEYFCTVFLFRIHRILRCIGNICHRSSRLIHEVKIFWLRNRFELTVRVNALAIKTHFYSSIIECLLSFFFYQHQ